MKIWEFTRSKCIAQIWILNVIAKHGEIVWEMNDIFGTWAIVHTQHDEKVCASIDDSMLSICARACADAESNRINLFDRWYLSVRARRNETRRNEAKWNEMKIKIN